jgi:hypothetical protein
MACRRCGAAGGEAEQHSFYTWDITHECGHKVTYRAICDDFAFSSPLVGRNTSTLLLHIAGEPCRWCGGQAYKDAPVEAIPDGVDTIRLSDRSAHPRAGNLLATRAGSADDRQLTGDR